MLGCEIVARARKLKNYVYWYGGKRQKCTEKLACRLMKENPHVWTQSYLNKAMADIRAGASCADCSALVCYAYGIPDIGSSSIKSNFKVWAGNEPKAGMIAWKQGHVGIFVSDGWGSKIAEMRGIDYDYKETRTYKEAGFTHVLYDPNVDYTTDTDEVKGWHKDAFGWWYRHTKGVGADTYYHDCFKVINGHSYYFDDEGYICTPVGHVDWQRVPATSEEGWLDG